jgi:putative transcriptional regulator
MKTDPTSSRVTRELLEMADDMHRIGIMDAAMHHQITARDLGRELPRTAAPISSVDIRAARKREHLSQAALARYLNVSVGFVSQLERGTREAKGRPRVRTTRASHSSLPHYCLADRNTFPPQQKKGRTLRPAPSSTKQRRRGLEIHIAHAAHSAATGRHPAAGALLLRTFSHHRLGGHQ